MKKIPVADRIRSKIKVNDAGCWEWTAFRTEQGYGRIQLDRKFKGAHRVSYREFCGPIPDGLHVLHRCDNPSCVNPDHLFLGTNDDNVADKVKKGRQRRHHGEANPHSRLTAADVLAIRASTERRKDLAEKYGVTPTCIYDVRVGKSWGHL